MIYDKAELDAVIAEFRQNESAAPAWLVRQRLPDEKILEMAKRRLRRKYAVEILHLPNHSEGGTIEAWRNEDGIIETADSRISRRDLDRLVAEVSQ